MSQPTLAETNETNRIIKMQIKCAKHRWWQAEETRVGNVFMENFGTIQESIIDQKE